MSDTLLADADRRFRAAAAAQGLLDVAYDLLDSPVGGLLAATTPRGVCRIAFDPDGELELEALARAYGARVLRSPRALDPLRRELDGYFQQRLRSFDVDVDLSAMPPFGRRVLDELRRIPYGKTESYGGLATSVGRPRAARAVGGALNRNPIPIVVPCHRVVGASGGLVGYAGGLERKRALLELEGAAL
ncbi:MAG: methylated-DNA--[protein]-cysteine S-methyltransferase [Thermoleophilia bacterium]|nr:methylated-DNA--[protein]-cysteine S-methyltransferase [Thermoleophilia bacterium]